MADCFGADSIDYLNQSWARGERFRCELSDTRDFVGTLAVPEEVFTPIIVADLFMQSPRPPWLRALMQEVSRLTARSHPVHFFRDPALLPPDTDCTAIAFSVAARAGLLDPGLLDAVAERIAENTTPDGVIQVYFDAGGERDGIVDAVVAANALYLLNLAGRVEQARATESYVHEQLTRRAFAGGTRYYPSPDTFLYFMSRLVTAFPMRYARWCPSLMACLRERQGLESRPLELAQRILASTRLGMNAALDAWYLEKYRSAVGSFPADALFRYGRRARFFGGEAITTAFAARAFIEYGRSLRMQTGGWPGRQTRILRLPVRASAVAGALALA